MLAFSFIIIIIIILNKKSLAGAMETVRIICSIDMMPLRLVSSFKLSFWQIKIRLFPDNSGCAKPPCSACRNGGTNEGRKYLCYLDLIPSIPFASILSEYFAALRFLQILQAQEIVL